MLDEATSSCESDVDIVASITDYQQAKGDDIAAASLCAR